MLTQMQMAVQKGTICKMEIATIPDNAKSLATVLAIAVDLPAGGRLELVFDEDLRCVEAFKKPRHERIGANALASTSIFCSCLINTSTVTDGGGNDVCVVCRRTKRPSSNLASIEG
jgi:hypothetical protein